MIDREGIVYVENKISKDDAQRGKLKKGSSKSKDDYGNNTKKTQRDDKQYNLLKA